MAEISAVTTDTKLRRKPWLAGLLSLFISGWGHFYCGRVKAAVIWFCISTIVNAICIYSLRTIDTAPLNVLIYVVISSAVTVIVIVSAYRTARAIGSNFVPGWYSRLSSHVWLVIVVIMLGYVSFPPVSQLSFFSVPQPSMENAILAGDRILCSRIAYCKSSPKVDDIIVFEDPDHGLISFVKRCVAVAGDTVEIKNKTVYVNGNSRQEPATIKHIETQHNDSLDQFGPLVVPTGTVFVLGDNRDDSKDSRTLGPIPISKIIGRAVRIYWSSDWDRVGKSI